MRTVRIDIFEPKEIEDELVKLGIPVERHKLVSGDFEIGDVGLERKKMPDFFSSLRTGRIFDQIKFLWDYYPRKALIIEGKITPKLAMRFRYLKGDLNTKMRFLHHRLEGFKTGMFLGFNLPIFETKDHADTAWLLANLHTKITEKKPFERPIGIAKSHLTPEQIREEMVALIPMIGRKGAKILLKSSEGTIDRLIHATEEELSLLKGMGKQRIISIKKILK